MHNKVSTTVASLLIIATSACTREAAPSTQVEAVSATSIDLVAEKTALETTSPPKPTITAIVLAETPTPKSIEKDFEDFDAKAFGSPTVINNSRFPLRPGMRFTYEGATEQDGQMVPHRFIMTVTDLTKVIGGVRSLVTWDQDFAAGQLVEAELAFYAQDNQGNVWLMGEYPEEYEDGKFVKAPSWIHGFEDAQAGIAMQATPQMGSTSYSQGWGPAVGWTDRGKVHEVGAKVCVPVKCYDDVLVIAESSAAEPNAYQLKLFASGVGNIRVDWLGADVIQEKLELAKLEQLGAEAIEQAGIEALKLEKHAYETANPAYAKTLPLEGGAPVATSAAIGAAPDSLLKIEAQVEDIMDVVPDGNWTKASDDVSAVESAWASYQKQAAKDGATQSLLDAFGQKLSLLKTASNAKSAPATMQAANDLSAVVVDLYDVYHPAIPTDLGRLDVLERQIVLDVDRKDLDAAAKTLGAIKSVWERLRPLVLSQNVTGEDVAKQFEKSIAIQAAALEAKDATALKDEARNSLELVDAIDMIY